MNHRTTRRTFVKQIGTAGLALPAVMPRLTRAASPNGKIRHATVGAAGMPWTDVRNFARNEHFELAVACDVDLRRLAGPKEQFPGVRTYQDWREMLEKEADGLDSVNVGTPDHMHAPVTITALREGLPVYCQKPLTHDIHEARQLRRAAREAGVVTQMGIQNHSRTPYRMAVQMLRDGVIGRVKRVYLWCNKPPRKYRPKGPRPEGSDPVPKELDWDKWLGTAPARPFAQGVYHPDWWRGWRDFGGGWLGDMGCHILDPAYDALGLSNPTTARAEVEPAWRKSPARFREVYPQWQVVDWEFPGTERTAGDSLTVTWSDGGKFPPQEARDLLEGRDFPDQGGLYIGEEGAMLLPHVGGPQLFPKEKYRGHDRPEIEPTNHWDQYLNAVRGEDEASAPFDYAAPLTEAVLLGTVAIRTPGQTLEWDAERMKVTNNADANALLKREYRKGWEVEGLG